MALTEKMIKCVCGDRYKRELSNFCGNVYEEYLVINGKRVKNEIPFHIFVKEEGKQRFDRWIEKEYNRRLEESLRRQILTEEDYIERIIYATGVYHTWYDIDTEKERDEWDANIRQRALHLYSLGFKPKEFCILDCANVPWSQYFKSIKYEFIMRKPLTKKEWWVYCGNMAIMLIIYGILYWFLCSIGGLFGVGVLLWLLLVCLGCLTHAR